MIGLQGIVACIRLSVAVYRALRLAVVGLMGIVTRIRLSVAGL